MQGPAGARTLIDGREFDYFSGTGYLGLQTHPAVTSAAAEALQRYGVSTATSRGSYGEHEIYDDLEAEARAFLGCEQVTYFASGYMGAAILMQGEGRAGDHIFIDVHAHTSLWDAALLANRPVTSFRHRDVDDLRAMLAAELQPGERPLILTDGIFPISGEIAPLQEYAALAEEHDGLVFVDDAHALGVLGENGRGTAEHFGVSSPRIRSCATLAKALGGYGGVIGGSGAWIETLERKSGALIGASPPPLVVAAASAAGLRTAREHPELRLALRENIRAARVGLAGLGLVVEDTPSPIICLAGESGLNLPRIRDGLFARGIAVSLVRSYPSAPPGGGLRIAIFATHTSRQIERLVAEIKELA